MLGRPPFTPLSLTFRVFGVETTSVLSHPREAYTLAHSNLVLTTQ